MLTAKGFVGLCVGLAIAVGAGVVSAGEMVVEGRVVRVVPIHGQDTVATLVGECDPVRPAADASLSATLAWDLNAYCHTEQRPVEVVQGYRVYYEWDDRLFETVMTEEPAETIPLRVRVR